MSEFHTIKSWDSLQERNREVTLRGVKVYEHYLGPRSRFAVYLGDDGLVYLFVPYGGRSSLDGPKGQGRRPGDTEVRRIIAAYVPSRDVQKVLEDIGATGQMAELGEKPDLDAELRQITGEQGSHVPTGTVSDGVRVLKEHERLTEELRSGVAAPHIDDNDSLVVLVRKLHALLEHDYTTMSHHDFTMLYGNTEYVGHSGLEADIQRAVRKWVKR